MSFCQIKSSVLIQSKKKEMNLIADYSSKNLIHHALLITELSSTDLIKECACLHCHVLSNHYSREKRDGINYYLGEFIHLPFSKASVDLIVLSHTLEKNSTAGELIRESATVLSEGGSLMIFVFSALLSHEKVKEYLKETELEIMQFGSLAGPLYAFPKNKVLSFIDKILSIVFPSLDHAFFIIAKKTTIPTNIIPTRSSLTQKLIMPLPSQCATQIEGPSI